MDRKVARLIKDTLPWFLAPGSQENLYTWLFCAASHVRIPANSCVQSRPPTARGGPESRTSRVCIVGAGLAGLTAAAMMVRAGAKVTLIEQSAGPLSMQLGNYVRLIHPRILTWPEQGTEVETTDLPVLNWKAASAQSVGQARQSHWVQ